MSNNSDQVGIQVIATRNDVFRKQGNESRPAVGAWVLSRLSRKPQASDYRGGTLKTQLETALDFFTLTVPGFPEIIKDKYVLDYGCGWGWQAIAMLKRGAKGVVGVDIQELETARNRAREYGCGERVKFVGTLDPGMHAGAFDVAVSCSSFEHFSKPEQCLRQMTDAVKPGGRVVISFAEPWYSPHGSHMNFFTRVPWVNLLFSEKTVMQVRSQFRNDGACRYEEVAGGLNRMTLAKFEDIIRQSSLELEFLGYRAVKGLPAVTRIPLVRELLAASAACTLRKPL